MSRQHQLRARPGVTRVALSTLLGVALFGVMACGDVVYEYIDPPFTIEGEDTGGTSGPAEVDMGFEANGAFTSLAEDDRLQVIHGLQGGTWTMPTIRTKGLDSFAEISCTVTTEAASEEVGRVVVKSKFFPSLDGPLELRGFPIPINHAPPNEGADIDDLYGQDATFECTITDDAGRSQTESLAVVLTES